MKHIQIIFFYLGFFTTSIFAQAPSNDECNNAIDLGTAPICEEAVAFTNINATTSPTPKPSCFVGTEGQRDVWFSFTTSPDIQEYEVRVKGLENGPNNDAIGNPQVTLYRGTCNGLSELSCASAENGTSEIALTVSNLPAGLTFFIRVNDYSATTNPNAGDFSICVEEFVPAIIMGETANTNACSGTLFDSGGPDGNYENFENSTLTICPQTPSTCIIFDVVSYELEFEFDVLSFFAGEDTEAPLLARVSGSNFGTPFPIQASSECVTLQFISDNSTTQRGFEINWQCETNCPNTSLDQITPIAALPFSGSFSSCDVPASFAETACGTDVFLNGPEKVFRFDSPGDLCASITIENAEENVGVLVLNGLPQDPNTSCVAISETGNITSVDMNEAGTYYIVVAQPFACANFDISIEEADCILSPALLNALCNPLNGCLNEDGTPSEFIFQDGFQDVTLEERVNSGCWLNEGIEADFFWFTLQAQADGKFGFILESADVPSDIDFNVWGPFSSEQVCNDKDAIVEFIEDNQPIRSSWADSDNLTGLADIHPIFRTPVNDAYDCINPIIPSPLGNDFVRTIDASRGDVYVVLINDFGDNIESNAILVDWSPSDPEVLQSIPIEISETQEICQGESVQLNVSGGIDNVTWFPAATLSCDDCLNPIASPDETTLYQVFVEGVCTSDTLEVLVEVIQVDVGEDVTICAGEDFQVNASSDFESASFEWIFPPQVELSCTDCPNPIITSSVAGTYTIRVNLITDECPSFDEFQLTVLATPAPEFEVADDLDVCVDELPVNIGSEDNDNSLTYNWTSIPIGFTSSAANPSVNPTETTTYFVSVTNGICPVTSRDSVKVSVSELPNINLITPESVCQGDTIFLSEDLPQEGVSYRWTGPGSPFIDTSIPNTAVVPQTTGTYSLTATLGACTITRSVQVNVTPIGINILTSAPDTTRVDVDTILLCLGTGILLEADPDATRPSDVVVNWFSLNAPLSDTIGSSVLSNPKEVSTYIATVENMGCIRMDTLVAVVDSLPDLAITPVDTMICEGSVVVLTSETYEPFQYPAIEFEWTPAIGQQTGDSLLNLVVTPDTTTTYLRASTIGACISIDSVTVIVNPLPEIQIVPQNPVICPGESVQLNVELLNPEEVTIESYMWSPPEGLSCMDCPNPIASTPNSYTVEVMSEEMCPGSASVGVTIANDEVLNLVPNTSICQGESIQLNDISGDGITYTWTSNDPDFTDINNPTPNVMPSTTATYMVTATGGDCPPVTQEVTITVIPRATTLSADATAARVCEGDAVTLSATSDGAGTFTWTGGGISEEGQSIQINPTENATYIVSLVSPCANLTAEVSVLVDNLPILDLIDDTTLCPGEEVNLANDFTPEVVYEWTSAEDENFDRNAANPLVSPTSTATYNVSVSNGLCPEQSDMVIVTVVDIEEIGLVVNAPIGGCLGDEITITAEAEIEGTFVWPTATFNNVRTSSITEIASEDLTEFEVTFSDAFGCTSETRLVTINLLSSETAVPNVFTPNGDGTNDTFRLFYANAEAIQFEMLQVFDRWGNKVFETTELEAGWDGTRNGEGNQPLPSDAYAYSIIYTENCGDSNRVELTGKVILLR
ncbi:MAG: gliding motility-associated C-terminal domain-containing protein [Bacteroidota bacterium]